ncbi:hypothetical protein KDL45_07950, partial [bacterium]|nr:hypothetical protein [bacterium]
VLEDYELDLGQLATFLPSGEAIKTVIEIQIPALGQTPLEIPVEIDDIQGSIIADVRIPLEASLAMVDFWEPQQLSWGVAIDPTDQWTVSLDATWYDWSEYPSPDLEIKINDVNINVHTLPANIQARIRNLTVPVLGTVGPVPPATIAIPGLDASLSIPVHLAVSAQPKTHDVIHPRIGVEHRFAPVYEKHLGKIDYSARAGYAYEPSPFETDGGYVNLIDPDRHLFTLGGGAEFNDRFSVDTYVQYRYLPEVSFGKSTIDADVPFEHVSGGGHILATGIQGSVTW